MRKMRSVCVALAGFVVILGLGSVAQAGVGLTLKAGTTGVGGDLTFRLNENLNLRAGVSYFNMTQDVNEANAELNLLNIPVLVDWYPSKNSGFRISTGAMFSDNYVKISARNKQVNLNGTDYNVATLDGKIDFDNTISPYLGIGWGNAVNTSSRWHFAADIGVAFSGSSNGRLNGTIAAVDPHTQAQLDAAITEQLRKYKDDAGQVQIFPVVTIGLSYAF